MSRTTLFTLRPPLGELLPLLVFGAGLVSLIGATQAAGELCYILECAGAIGGTRP